MPQQLFYPIDSVYEFIPQEKIKVINNMLIFWFLFSFLSFPQQSWLKMAYLP